MPWAPSYASLDELRDYVRISDDADDIVMSTALDAASRAIDHACDPRVNRVRQFGRTETAQPRYYTATSRGFDVANYGQWVAETDDIADPLGSIEVAVFSAGVWVEVLGCAVLPRNAAAIGWPGTSILFPGALVPTQIADGVRVTTEWGWPEIPGTIHQAALLQASRLLARREAPFGVAGSPETGTEIRLLARLDPDVETMVRPFSRKLGAVLA